MRHFMLIVVAVLFVVAGMTARAPAQFKDKGVRIGVAGGVLGGLTKTNSNKIDFASRIFLRHNIVDYLDGDLSGSAGSVHGDAYQSDLWMAEYKLLYKPFAFDAWEPYGGIGLGVVNYFANANLRDPAVSKDGYVAFLPIALGTEYAIDDDWTLDANANLNYAFSGDIVSTRLLNTGIGTGNDAWWAIYVGISYVIGGTDNDADNDGLKKSEEKQLGTDPDKADTDGDGLSDGDEVNKYHTNPLKADTDGDGLSDGDEVMKYKTDPLKADTDGDGLSDGDEVMKYKTDPLKADTDGDGLSDGDEVMKYKTDPLKADTDGDGFNDGIEVLNKTDPLDPKSPTKEVPKPVETPKAEALKAEVGKAIVLEGVTFKSGSTTVQPASEPILSRALSTFLENPTIDVEIRGYTDNVGSAKANTQLSQKRADAVRTWLVKRGIPAARIKSKGYGSANPIAPNTTAEGRAQNRRIEFFRTK